MIRHKIATALAGIGLAAGLLLSAAALPAGASTSAAPPKANATLVCAGDCFNLSNLQLDAPGVGSSIMNAVGGKSGTTLNIRPAGINKSNEDFSGGQVTTVGDILLPDTACGSGILSPSSIFCLNPAFKFDGVYQADFAPFSNQTGLCAGVPEANAASRITLIPCATPGVEGALSLWVLDSANHPVVFQGHIYAPVLNGGDTSFSHPLALTVNPGSKHPVNVLRTDEENTTANFIPDNQMFTFTVGHAIA